MTNEISKTLEVDCPCCASSSKLLWATENGYSVFRCQDCRFLYLNPRPSDERRKNSTESGIFDGSDIFDISEKYSKSKIKIYSKLYKNLFNNANLETMNKSWLDIGCGYGEIIKSIKTVCHPTCQLKGVEPMTIKARIASRSGLDVINDFYNPSIGTFDFISIHDVFSHIPDPITFFKDVRQGLQPGGYLILETGNLADLENRSDFPGDLGLPDHMTFGGLSSIRSILERNGLQIVSEQSYIIDGIQYFVKNIIKRLLGRNVIVKLPYRSQYRTLIILAKAI